MPCRNGHIPIHTAHPPPLFISVEIIMDFGGRSIECTILALIYISPFRNQGNFLCVVFPETDSPTFPQPCQFQSLKLTHSALSFFPQPRCRAIIDGLRNLQDLVKKVLAQDKKIFSIAETIHKVHA